MATDSLLTPAPAPTAPLLVSEREAARLLGVSARTIFTLAKRGDLPVARVMGRKLFSVAAINDFIARRTEGGAK